MRVSMRICFIASKSIHTKRWIEYYSKKGYDIHLITNESDDYHKCKVYEVNYKLWSLSPLFKAIAIRKIVRRIKPDIVHAHQVTPFGLYGYLSGCKPFVLTAWGSDIFIMPKKSILIKYLTKLVLKHADLITCDSVHLNDEMVHLDANSEKIEIILFGTDSKKFDPCKRDESFKANLFPSKSKVVISLRNLKPIYNVKTLIKSIPMVLDVHPETKFLICGRGTEEDLLKQMASSLNVSNSIKFLNWIPNDDLPKYIASSDIYVSTSLSDGGLAASTAEAMACELPVIITDFGVNREWVEDGVNGYIVPLKDPNSLAKKIIFLLNNEKIRQDFGKRSRKVIEERLDYYKELEKMDNLYNELVNR